LPGSLVSFWVIDLQRRVTLTRPRLTAFSVACAIGGATLLLLLSMLLSLFGNEFNALAPYRLWLAVYAALMGAAAAIMSTAVAVGRVGIPTIAFLLSASVRLILLREIAADKEFLPVFLVLCITELLTIGLLLLGYCVPARVKRVTWSESE